MNKHKLVREFICGNDKCQNRYSFDYQIENFEPGSPHQKFVRVFDKVAHHWALLRLGLCDGCLESNPLAKSKSEAFVGKVKTVKTQDAFITIFSSLLGISPEKNNSEPQKPMEFEQKTLELLHKTVEYLEMINSKLSKTSS